MINWFDMPAEGLSNGGQFEVKELEVTENGTYEEKGEMYNKVTVNVEGGGGSSDFSTAKVTIIGHNDARVFMSPSFPYVADNNTSVIMGVQEENSHIYTVVLYKGSAWGVVRNADIIAMTGGVELSQDEEYLIITGDGTLTINPWQD